MACSPLSHLWPETAGVRRIVFGSAKAAPQALPEGLRARLFTVGVHVVDFEPGFVATLVTAGLPLPGSASQSP
jgi:hypothetical protein